MRLIFRASHLGFFGTSGSATSDTDKSHVLVGATKQKQQRPKARPLARFGGGMRSSRRHDLVFLASEEEEVGIRRRSWDEQLQLQKFMNEIWISMIS